MTASPRPARSEPNECLAFLATVGVWHRISHNPPVRSCADAAGQRRRLGNVGIPLCDELKSLMCAYTSPDRQRRYVLVSCRAHQQIDLDKCAVVLGAPVQRIDEDELRAVFGAEYGTVTPFAFAGQPHVHQFVDETVLETFFSPYTMMTNAGDLERAVEFRPAETVAALPSVVVCDIVVDEHRRVPSEVLGIVTGNSPESGMLLWKRVNERIRKDDRVRTRGDADFPRLVIESVPGMGASMELSQREADVRPVVLDAVRRLCNSGATVVALACNTTQYFASEIQAVCDGYGARFLSLAEETGAHLRRAGVVEVDFLAIEPVTDDRWSDFRRALDGVEVHVPDRAHLRAIADLAFLVKQEVVSPGTVNRLRDLIQQATRTRTVVLALTELSIVLSAQKERSRSGKQFVDTLDVLAASMAEIHIQERLATGGA